MTSSFVAVRGLLRSLNNNLGVEPANAMLVNADLHMAGYGGDRMKDMQKQLVDAMAALPGVESAAMINIPPLELGSSTGSVFKEDVIDLRPANAIAAPYLYQVSPGYFRTAGTKLLAGREITPHDDSELSSHANNAAPLVAVVNRELANRLFGSVSRAVGAYFKRTVNNMSARIQVIGVVEDGKYQSLTEDRAPAVFFSARQITSNSTWLVVHASGNSQQLGGSIRGAIRNIDDSLPVFIESWSEGMDAVLFPARTATVALGVLGFMGAILSLTGIFGMAAYSVSKRLKEIGVRIAIGAHSRDILRAALGRAFNLLAVGSTAGLGLGILASRVLSSLVYGATPRDPLVLGAVVIAMSLLGLLATWIPARRALSIDPLRLLREE